LERRAEPVLAPQRDAYPAERPASKGRRSVGRAARDIFGPQASQREMRPRVAVRLRRPGVARRLPPVELEAELDESLPHYRQDATVWWGAARPAQLRVGQEACQLLPALQRQSDEPAQDSASQRAMAMAPQRDAPASEPLLADPGPPVKPLAQPQAARHSEEPPRRQAPQAGREPEEEASQALLSQPAGPRGPPQAAVSISVRTWQLRRPPRRPRVP
jgi:hypothetical protein